MPACSKFSTVTAPVAMLLEETLPLDIQLERALGMTAPQGRGYPAHSYCKVVSDPGPLVTPSRLTGMGRPPQVEPGGSNRGMERAELQAICH